jgi:anti-sigma regulatory factor (Ser/Thr protein kinase)
MDEVLQVYAPLLESVPAARSFVSRSLTDWECDRLIETVTLLTSELVTNAIVHARGPVSVRMTVTERVLRVEVNDHSRQLPRRRSPGPDDEVGRGMVVVEELAQQWGTEEAGDGKVVWFEVPVT